jgi:hypothetical protein
MPYDYFLRAETEYRIQTIRQAAARRNLARLALAGQPPRRPLRLVLRATGHVLIALGQRLQGHGSTPATSRAQQI